MPSRIEEEETPPPEQQADLYNVLQQDMLDFLGHNVIHTSGYSRIVAWKAFYRAYDDFPYTGEGYEYGMVHGRFGLAQLAMCLTVPEVNAEDENSALLTNLPGDFPADALVSWSSTDWDGFATCIHELVEGLLRQNSRALHPDGGGDDDHDAATKEEQKLLGAHKRKVFFNKRRNITRCIRIHELLAPFREALMEQLNDMSKRNVEEAPVIDATLLAVFRKEVEAEPDKTVREILLDRILDQSSFSTEETTPSKTRSSKKKQQPADIKLQSIAKLRQRFTEKPFCLNHFYDRVQEALVKWSDEVYGKPRLWKFYFAEDEDDPNSNNKGTTTTPKTAVNELKAARETLGDSVVDPLDEVLEVISKMRNKRKSLSAADVAARPAPAQKKAKKRAGRLLEKHSSAVRLQFSQDGYEDDDGEVEDSASENNCSLTDLPRHNVRQLLRSPSRSPSSAKKSQRKKYEGRRLWSEDEKLAVKEGIKTYGLGKWAVIKKDYQVILGERTSGQISDCYRTMLRLGQLEDLEKEGYLE